MTQLYKILLALYGARMFILFFTKHRLLGSILSHIKRTRKRYLFKRRFNIIRQSTSSFSYGFFPIRILTNMLCAISIFVLVLQCPSHFTLLEYQNFVW